VQSGPAKLVMVADIAREAEAIMREVAMKTMLNCIIVKWRSFQMTKKKWSKLKII
jgi:hypothetical protein